MTGFMKSRIPFISPEFPSFELLAKDYHQMLDNNWYTNFGPFEKTLCRDISRFIDHDISTSTVSSATTGLLLAVKAFYAEPTNGCNEVLMPAFTFAAGAEALILLGYKPIFIDIKMDNWQPDLSQAEAYVSQNKGKVCGILFCNIFGVGSPTIYDWESFAETYKLPMVIDSAAGFGSKYTDGSYLGARGNCEVFSFHATKPFAVGEGGAVTSKDREKIDLIKSQSNFGFDKSREVKSIGINAKLQELNAALGIRQLRHLEDRIKLRQDKLRQYKSLLEPKGFIFQANDELSSVAFVSVLAPSKEQARNFIKNLQEDDVDVRNYYNPHLYEHRVLRESSKKALTLTVTEKVCSRIISLPAHHELTPGMIERIVASAP